MNNLPKHLKCIAPLLVLTVLQLSACSNAAAVADNSGVDNTGVNNAAATPQNSGRSGYQLQVLKDCKVLSERTLNTQELKLYQELQLAEQRMKQLEAPLKKMEVELATQSKALEHVTSQIEQQAGQRQGPDPSLLEQQAEFSNKISAVVDSHQADIDALSSQGQYIATVATEFEQLVIKPLDKGSYDQIRLFPSGDKAPTDCQQGMFFSAAR